MVFKPNMTSDGYGIPFRAELKLHDHDQLLGGSYLSDATNII